MWSPGAVFFNRPLDPKGRRLLRSARPANRRRKLKYGQTIGLLVVACLALAAADDGPVTQAWQAADGARYWRVSADGRTLWELADADGDGKVDVAIFPSGDRYARVEIDTDADGAADRVYLFQPDGAAAGYLDANGDGVLETPSGTRSEREATLREIGRGGKLFKKALEMRLLAGGAELRASDEPAPAAWPPFSRPAGEELSFELRLTLIPVGDAAMLQRQDDPIFLGQFVFAARAGVGRSFGARPIALRTDPSEQIAPLAGRLAVDLYPVWVTEPAADGSTAKKLILQLSGRLDAGRALDEQFFLTETLADFRPATITVPVRDFAGRVTKSLLVEVRRK